MRSQKEKNIRWSDHIASISISFTVMLVSGMVTGLFMLFFDYTSLIYSVKIAAYCILVASLTGIPCYFICRHNYRSVWYVPAVTNLGTLIIASKGFLANYWSSYSRLTLLLVTVSLSILLSIMGSKKGKKTSAGNIAHE